MARIPVPSLQVAPSAAQFTPPQASYETAAAPFRALQQVGAAMQDNANVLGRIALDQQNFINRGRLAHEDTVRRNVLAEIEAFNANNASNPELWEPNARKQIASYEQSRQSRIDKEGWGQFVTEADDISMNDLFSKASINLNASVNKAMINQSNSRLHANAHKLWQAGDIEGAESVLNEMNLYPAEKERIKSQSMNEWSAEEVSMAVQQTTAVADLEALRGELNKTEGQGYHPYRPEIDSGTRMKLAAQIGTQIRQVRVQQSGNSQNMLRDIRLGNFVNPDEIRRQAEINDNSTIDPTDAEFMISFQEQIIAKANGEKNSSASSGNPISGDPIARGLQSEIMKAWLDPSKAKSEDFNEWIGRIQRTQISPEAKGELLDQLIRARATYNLTGGMKVPLGGIGFGWGGFDLFRFGTDRKDEEMTPQEQAIMSGFYDYAGSVVNQVPSGTMIGETIVNTENMILEWFRTHPTPNSKDLEELTKMIKSSIGEGIGAELSKIYFGEGISPNGR